MKTVIAIALLLVTGSVSAASITGTASCRYSALNQSRPFYGNQGSCITITDTNFKPGSANDFAAAPVLPGAQVGASYSLRALFGDLGAFSDAYANASFSSNGIDTIAPHLASNARVDTAFQEGVVLASTILSIGTPVSVRYSGRFEGEIVNLGSTGNGPTTFGFAFASFSLGGQPGTFGEQFCIGFAQAFCTRDKSGSFSYTFQAKIGDRFLMQSALETYVEVNAISSQSNPFIRVSSTAASFDSAHTFLDPASSNFYIQSDSGHDYTSPVPEPSTGLLLVSGLMVLLHRHRVSSILGRRNCVVLA